MSLRQLECYVGWEIAGGYHYRIQSTLMRSPLAVWREREGEVKLRMPHDRMAFWVSFLPEERRTLRPDGIWLNGLPYWSNFLSADLGRAKRELLVKYGPRDISRIFLQRPSGRFIEARTRDLSFPSISLREWNQIKSNTRTQAKAERNPNQWRLTAQAKRRIVEGIIAVGASGLNDLVVLQIFQLISRSKAGGRRTVCIMKVRGRLSERPTQ
jgi:putative transposase